MKFGQMFKIFDFASSCSANNHKDMQKMYLFYFMNIKKHKGNNVGNGVDNI